MPIPPPLSPVPIGRQHSNPCHAMPCHVPTNNAPIRQRPNPTVAVRHNHARKQERSKQGRAAVVPAGLNGFSRLHPSTPFPCHAHQVHTYPGQYKSSRKCPAIHGSKKQKKKKDTNTHPGVITHPPRSPNHQHQNKTKRVHLQKWNGTLHIRPTHTSPHTAQHTRPAAATTIGNARTRASDRKNAATQPVIHTRRPVLNIAAKASPFS